MKTDLRENSVKLIEILFAVLFIFLSCFLLLYIINLKGNNPWGSDVYGHIFKSDLLYKNMLEGNYYPLYTDLWYNGIQPFRYWAPIPYYIMAGFQFLSGGNAIIAYNLFVGFCFLVGALGWLIWGIREDKIVLAAIISVLWFMMPDNVRVFFSEGNMPRVTIAFLLPYIFYFIWLFIEHKKKYAMIFIILLMSLICLSHLMIAAMLGITVFIFLLYHSILYKNYLKQALVIIGMLLGIALCGIWLYPALKGGLMSLDSGAVSEVMKQLTFSFTRSLNPGLRLKNIEVYYFGLSFFLVSVFGILFAQKKGRASFLTVMTIFLGTTTAFVPILIKLPLNQLLWMMRFTPIAYGAFCIGLLNWKNIRKYVLILIILLIGLDSGISFKILAFHTNLPQETVTMFQEAKEATNSRLAILDLSEFGSFPSYYLCSEERKTPYAYGWAWQGATTSENIVLLNTALEQGYYSYIFDRCIELGCDTVLFKKDKIENFNLLYSDARMNQYEFLKEYQNGYLFKRNTPAQFGTMVSYYGLAIGNSAKDISLEFPGFQIANKKNLNEYTLEELLKYEVLFLSDFTYKDKESAESLIKKAAEQGVKILIDMNRIPTDPDTQRMTFLDVTAQSVKFENRMPDLYYNDKIYYPISFKKEYQTWNTVYLDGISNPMGYANLGGNKLTFLGQNDSANITFIGFNILYHGMVNEDSSMISIYSQMIGRQEGALPKREIVPINVSINQNKIEIDSKNEQVLTSLAAIDAFLTEDEISSVHQLVQVTKPHTEIQITYPYPWTGVLISILAFCLIILFLIYIYKSKKCLKKG